MTIGIDLGDVWSHYCKLNHTDGSIDSPLEPQPAPSLHQDSSSRVRTETRWRATCGGSTRHLGWGDGRRGQSPKYDPEHRGLTSLGACVQRQRGLLLSGWLYRRLS